MCIRDRRNAYAISQNLSELIAPSAYDSLDENTLPVSEDTLAPYLALIEHITNCNVYVIDVEHNVTGYFNGVVQTLQNPLLPGYIEQTIALGFMGKTPFIQARPDEDTHCLLYTSRISPSSPEETMRFIRA